jgi:hypothetical protein
MLKMRVTVIYKKNDVLNDLFIEVQNFLKLLKNVLNEWINKLT